MNSVFLERCINRLYLNESNRIKKNKHKRRKQQQQIILGVFCRDTAQSFVLILRGQMPSSAKMGYKEVWLFIFDSINRDAFITNKAKLVM